MSRGWAAFVSNTRNLSIDGMKLPQYFLVRRCWLARLRSWSRCIQSRPSIKNFLLTSLVGVKYSRRILQIEMNFQKKGLIESFRIQSVEYYFFGFVRTVE